MGTGKKHHWLRRPWWGIRDHLLIYQLFESKSMWKVDEILGVVVGLDIVAGE